MKNKSFTAQEFCLVKPFTFAVRRRVIDFIPYGNLLLKPVVAGICGSEMLYFKGQKEKEKLESRLPMCLLHEGVAEVVETGRGTSLKIGTQVVINPLIPCGECWACRNLGENMCRNSKFMASTADGLARTLFLYPEDRVIPVPPGVPVEVAALSEPFSVALNAYEVAEIRGDEKVAVIGDGAIGYLVALTVSSVGHVPPENLYLIGIIDEKLNLARDFATTLNSLKEEDRLRSLHEEFDVAFEAVGGAAHRVTLRQAIDLLRPGGRCILLGISKGEVPIAVTNVVNKSLTLKGSTRSRMEHYRKVLSLLEDDEIRRKVRRIISDRRFTIRTVKDLEEAFRYADTEEGEAKTKPGRVLVYFP